MSQLKTYQRAVADLLGVSVADTTDQAVSIDDAKLYARIDGNTDDIIVDMLIDSAREAFEDYTGKLLFQREVVATFDVKEASILYMPWLPIVEVTSVTKDDEAIEYDVKGDTITVDESGIIEVTYTAGLFDGQTDNAVNVGILKWIASNYDDRQDVAAMSVSEMPNSSMNMWKRYKTPTV